MRACIRPSLLTFSWTRGRGRGVCQTNHCWPRRRVHYCQTARRARVSWKGRRYWTRIMRARCPGRQRHVPVPVPVQRHAACVVSSAGDGSMMRSGGPARGTRKKKPLLSGVQLSTQRGKGTVAVVLLLLLLYRTKIALHMTRISESIGRIGGTGKRQRPAPSQEVRYSISRRLERASRRLETDRRPYNTVASRVNPPFAALPAHCAYTASAPPPSHSHSTLSLSPSLRARSDRTRNKQRSVTSTDGGHGAAHPGRGVVLDPKADGVAVGVGSLAQREHRWMNRWQKKKKKSRHNPLYD